MMDKSNKIISSLRFSKYVVNNVQFIYNQNYKRADKILEIVFGIDHNIKYESGKMLTTLLIDIFPDMEKNNYPFYMHVELKGFFTIDGDNFKSFETSSIAILYPYLRALVSTYTANSNVPTLILPPINVVAYLEDKNKTALLENKETEKK